MIVAVLMSGTSRRCRDLTTASVAADEAWRPRRCSPGRARRIASSAVGFRHISSSTATRRVRQSDWPPTSCRRLL